MGVGRFIRSRGLRMDIESFNFPEFAAATPVLVAEAVLQLISTDAGLKRWAKGGIHSTEQEDLFLRGSFTPPAIAVFIKATQLVPMIGDRHELETVLEVLLITKPDSASGTRQYLRQRAIDHIRTLVLAGDGTLRHPTTGELITEALTIFQRLPEPFVLPGDLLATRCEVSFRSQVLRDLMFEG